MAKEITPEQRAERIRERHKNNQRKLAQKRQLEKLRDFVGVVIMLHEFGESPSEIAKTIQKNNVYIGRYNKETFDNGIHIETV